MPFPVSALMLLALATAPASGADGTGHSFEVRVADERVSIRAVDAGLQELLRDLCEKAGIELHYYPAEAPLLISDQFDDLTYVEALTRLLDRTPGHLIIQEVGTTPPRVRSVFVMAGKGEAVVSHTTSLPDTAAVIRLANELQQQELPDSMRALLLDSLTTQPPDTLTATLLDENEALLEAMLEQLKTTAADDPEMAATILRRLDELSRTTPAPPTAPETTRP